MTVTFLPASNGNKTKSLSITHNDPGSPTSVTVKGRGENPNPQISVSASIDMGSVQLGSSNSQTLTISNSGNVTLVVSDISLSGTDAGDFSATPAAVNVSAGSSADVTVTLSPSSTGARAATLALTHNDNGSPTSVALSGTGLAAPATAAQAAETRPTSSAPSTWSPPSLSIAEELDFGQVVVGYEQTLALVATNAGNAAIRLSTPILDGVRSSTFRVEIVNRDIAAGESTSIHVTFDPSRSGSIEVTLTLRDRRSILLATVTLKAQAVQPVPSFSENRIDFGDVTVGESAARRVTVTNTGDGLLVVVAEEGEIGPFSVEPAELLIAGPQLKSAFFSLRWKKETSRNRSGSRTTDTAGVSGSGRAEQL